MAAAPPFARFAAAPSAGRLEKLRRSLGASGLCIPAGSGGLLVRHDEAVLAVGIPAIDAALGGGLLCGALHEIAASRETTTAAATGFALALAARVSQDPRPGMHPDLVESECPRSWKTGAHLSAGGAKRPQAASQSAAGSVFWIAEDLSLAENGTPYGPGLDQAGIAPERLITVATARGRDALWAMEEALRCPAVGIVIGELRARSIDQVATRRLSLAAAAGNALGFILRIAPDDTPSAAATRWIISPVSSSTQWGVGPPRLTVQLVRNRRGHLGSWIVEWNSAGQRFKLASHSEPVAGSAFDRPHRAAVA